MKENIGALFLCLIASTTFAQNAKFELPARNMPVISKEKLNGAEYLNDLSSILWHSLTMPLNEHYYLDQRRINDYPQPQPPGFIYPQEGYKLTVDYVGVEISIIKDGKTAIASSLTDKLTAEQKSLLAKADIGADINVKIRFRYKDQTKDQWGSRNKVIEGTTAVAVVPYSEAEYPGGYKQLSAYFAANVVNKVTDKNTVEKMQNAVIKFTVDEEGQMVNPQIMRTTSDTKIDKLLLESMSRMPKWKPAENSKGIKIKQEFTIPFASGC